MTTFWQRVARAQTRQPLIVLVVALLITVGLGSLGSKLTIAAGFEHLLPDGRESVVELNRVSKRTAGVSTLFVVLEAPPGSDKMKLREASNAIVKEAEAIGEPWVGSAENGVQEALAFFEKHGGLYVDKAELEALQKDVDEYFNYQVAKEMGTLIDESAPPPAAPLDPESVKKRFGVTAAAADRYPDGYFESQDGLVHVVTIRSKILGGDLDNGREAIRRVREAVDRVNLDSYQPGVKVGLAGDLFSGVAEVTAINDDVTDVGILGAIMIAAVVLLYYLRIRTLFVMLGSLGVGLVWTSGFAYLLVHQLNTATGFVFTIIAGNGLNTGIIYMARYLELRRKGDLTGGRAERMAAVEKAIFVAHSETFLATLCAAAASSASFLSLQLTAFRGFRELGLIGGVGLLLCWLAMLCVLPALLACVEWVSPLVKSPTTTLGRLRERAEQSFGRPFAFLVARAPRAIAGIGLAVGLAGCVATYIYIARDPFEYDMNKLRNDPASRKEEERVRALADAATGYVGAEGMAILVDDVAQVGPLRTALYAKRDAVPEELKPFDSVVALEDFVPKDQEDKIPILLEIRKKVEKARKRKAIKDEDWVKVERYLPPPDLKPIGLGDLPTGVARTFTELDGTRGRIVYIVPTTADATEDARYVLRWAESFRKTTLPDNSVVLGSGRAVIYADMWAGVIAAVPVAVFASAAAVAAVVLLTFRGGKASLLVLGALLMGIATMVLGFTVFNVKINFLNFVALPITFGLGVDYAVNVVWRATREGEGGALIAVKETGGAVVLASLTTMLGYFALVGSMNFAVRSLGVAASIGEVATLLSAMLILPGALMLLERRRSARATVATASSSAP